MLALRKPQHRRWAWELISLALQYQLLFPSCRRQEREGRTLPAMLAAPRGLLLCVPSLGKRATPGENGEVESQPSSWWDLIHPKTDWNDSDINFIMPELTGISIQAQHTREFQLTLPWPEDVGGKPDSWELSGQHPSISQLHQCEFHWCHLRTCEQLSKVFKVPTTSLWEK